MTAHELIERGAALTKEKQRIEAELARVRRHIEPLFPQAGTREVIESVAGRAVRTQTREWWIKPEHLDTVRGILGTAYANLIDPAMPLCVTPGLRDLITHPHSAVGLSLRAYIVVHSRTHIAFHDPLSETVVACDEDGGVVVELADMMGGGEDE